MKQVFGIELDTWSALNAIAAIISALGTLAAVIVALYLARRDQRPRMQVSASVMQMANSPQKVEFLFITGTNIGQLPLTVKGIFWTIGWYRKQTFITVPFENQYSEKLPKELTHGQQVRLVQPLKEFEAGHDTFIRYLRERWYRRYFIGSLRCGIYTSTGQFAYRPDASVMTLIKKAYEATSATKATKA
jgi:hypothetical protein